MRNFILTIAIVLFIVCGVSAQPHQKGASETSVVLEKSNLPVVVISPESEIQENERVQAQLGIIWNKGKPFNQVADAYNDYDGRIMIEYHGKSSLMFPKKSYRFETRTSNGENLNTRILDMPAEDDWILYAPYTDKTLMRNFLSYTLAGEINDYAPRVRYCELIVNDTYKGVYVMTEKIEEDGDRVDIADLDPQDNSQPDITGGYLFRKDKIDEWDNLLTLEWSNVDLIINEPKKEEISSAQEAWLTDYLNEFDRELAYEGNYAEYVDVLSFVHNFLIVEFTKNIDGYRLSTYFSKDRGEKIKAGPVWDYNLSFGNADYYQGWSPTGWYYPLPAGSPIDDIFWFEDIINDPVFFSYSANRWEGLRKRQFSMHHIFSMMEHWRQKLMEPRRRNFTKYPILGKYVWPNPGYPESGSQGANAPTTGAPVTWPGELRQMKQFIRERLHWMDEQFGVTALQAALEVANPSYGQIVHKGHIISDSGYAEVFAQDSNLHLHAVPAQGYRFKHWIKRRVGQQTEVIVDKASTWSYFDNGTQPAEGWNSIAFEDSTWETGLAQLGYGDGDEATVVDYGGDDQDKYVTTYFRHHFTVDDTGKFRELTAHLLCDDGALVYLNGSEVARFNMPEGEISYSTYASDYLSGEQETTFRKFSLPEEKLASGPNILAVEVHQANASSSDISFDMQLSGIVSNQDSAEIVGQQRTLAYKLQNNASLITARFESGAQDSVSPLINEFMAYNRNDIRDDFFENDDWIELYNPLNRNVDIGGLYLSDEPSEPLKYRIPANVPDETTIEAKDYLVLWADNDTIQGPLHLNFALDKNSEVITLATKTANQVRFLDVVAFHRQSSDVSKGRLPDGAGAWQQFGNTTPGRANKAVPVALPKPLKNSGYALKSNYPNPFSSTTTIGYRLPQEAHVKIAVYNNTGRLVEVLVDARRPAGLHTLKWHAGSFPPGIYFYKMVSGRYAKVHKALVVR